MKEDESKEMIHVIHDYYITIKEVRGCTRFCGSTMFDAYQAALKWAQEKSCDSCEMWGQSRIEGGLCDGCRGDQ